ncbi:MAG: hypothetical protein FWC45_05630 [Treponema sp.]|nr:hypothetical protein [Treponema sp.]
MAGNSRNFDKAREANIPQSAPDCFRCKHFRITWEPAFPRSCTLFGVKCRNLPAMEIFLSTGKHCFAFEGKMGNGEWGVGNGE